jgi:hypothetical protein
MNNINDKIDLEKMREYAQNLHNIRTPKVDLNPIRRIRIQQEELGYNEGNSVMYLAFDDEPDCGKIVNPIKYCFDLKNISVCVFQQNPGQMTAPHFDTFGGYRERYNITDSNFHKIKRFVIFLEDGAFGHVFSTGKNILHNWKQGDVVETGSDIYHASANCGVTPRVSLSVTGYDEHNLY